MKKATSKRAVEKLDCFVDETGQDTKLLKYKKPSRLSLATQHFRQMVERGWLVLGRNFDPPPYGRFLDNYNLPYLRLFVNN